MNTSTTPLGLFKPPVLLASFIYSAGSIITDVPLILISIVLIAIGLKYPTADITSITTGIDLTS